METLIVVVAVLVLLALVAAVQVKSAKGSRRNGTYRQRNLMTDNELEFFGRLVAALPGHVVFPQVAMSALIEAASSDSKQAHSDRLRIAQQRVDYVVCTRNGEVVAVVELDDRTHSQAKDRQRDARLEQAGIRTVRFQSRNKPTPAAIMVAVLGTPPAAVPPAAAAAPTPAAAH